MQQNFKNSGRSLPLRAIPAIRWRKCRLSQSRRRSVDCRQYDSRALPSQTSKDNHDSNLKDGFVEVKFKTVSGREDRAGGVVWRAKDADNYYMARANAPEANHIV